MLEFQIQIQRFDHDLVATDRECTVGNERLIRSGIKQHPRHIAQSVLVLMLDIGEDLVQVFGMIRPAISFFSALPRSGLTRECFNNRSVSNAEAPA